MKVLKVILGILAILIVVFLILGLTQPKEYHFEGSTIINASKEAIFGKVNNLQAWEEWEPWEEFDTTINITYGDKTEGAGASYSWTSEKSGNGKMTMVESHAPTHIKNELDFGRGAPAYGLWNFEDAEEEGTKVTWGFDMTVPFPMNAMMIFSKGKMEKGMNEMFENGLGNLKALCEEEAKSVFRGYRVQTVDFPAKNFIAVRGKLHMDELKAFYTENLPKLGTALAKNQREMDGMPCGIFYDWDEETRVTDMAAAIGVKGEGGIEGFESINMPAGKALAIDYYGAYEAAAEAHFAMDDYMKANNMEFAGPVIEEYVTDPGNEPDTSKWLTKIYYMVKL